MRVFISEFLVGGASLGSAVASSLRREGQLMLQAVTDDIARLPGASVVTTLEKGIPFSANVEVIEVESSADEAMAFQRLLNEVDAVLVIAPETGGVLTERCRRVQASGVRSWNCLPSSIALCGDKLRFAEHLKKHGIPTIPTTLVDLATSAGFPSSPTVLKLRDGAGSELIFLVENQRDWDIAAESFRECHATDQCISQPFVAGRALSVGVNISLDGRRMECLPVGEQHLSNDGRFSYLGGTVPANISASTSFMIHQLVESACKTIDGLAGYIGVDIVLAADGKPVIVEINPRLTTSYVGYRLLFKEAIPERWLSSADSMPLTVIASLPIDFSVSSASLFA